MSEFNISIPGGESKRLLTGGKYCPADILVTAEGRAEVVEKDVNFYDYDGTLLYSYTVDEIQALTELPPGKEHDGLVFDGWNWTLAGVKSLTRPMTIGAMYDTDDGSTRLYINIPDVMPMPFALPLYFSQNAANGISIDWGDGSAAETVGETGEVNTSHSFTTPGDYVIRLSSIGNCTLNLGRDGSTWTVFGAKGEANYYICNLLKKVELGRFVNYLYRGCFNRCMSLETITATKKLTSVGHEIFQDCFALKAFVMPYGMTTGRMYMLSMARALEVVAFAETFANSGEGILYNSTRIHRVDLPDSISAFGYGSMRGCTNLVTVNSRANGLLPEVNTYRNCERLTTIVIPQGTTAIPQNFASSCYSLLSVEIPASVTSIAANAFQYDRGMRRMRFLPTTPPAVANANAFEGIPADCVVEVPASSLDAYKNATNYSGIAAQMVGV